MNCTRALELGDCFAVDAMPLFFICFGCVSLFVGFVGDVNWNKKGIEQIDHFVVRKRTASQIGSPTSAAAQIHLPHIAEQKDRAPVLFGKPLGLRNAGNPPDGIETQLFRSRLNLTNALFNQVAVKWNPLLLFGRNRQCQKADAPQHDKP